MALYLRGKIWHYVFRLRGQEYRGSTLQSNKNRAKIVESKVRADAADALFGIGPAKQPPCLRDFIENTFLPHVRVKHQSRKNTVRFYEYRCATLLEFAPFAGIMRLSAIDSAILEKYIGFRLNSGRKSRGEGKVGLSTVNHELTVLKVALRYAWKELKLIRDIPTIRHIKGQQGRTFVVSGELEKAYLEAAQYPLKHAVILMCDLGLRPMEVCSMSKSDLSAASIQIPKSKSVAGIRTVPHTARSRDTLTELAALWPDSPWVFPGLVKDSHYSASALSALHTKLRVEKDWPVEFVLYSWRHTYGTRLAESGAKPYAIMKLMGHTKIETSMRYIHLSDESVTLDAKRAELYGKVLRGETEDATQQAPPIRNPS